MNPTLFLGLERLVALLQPALLSSCVVWSLMLLLALTVCGLPVLPWELI